VADDIAERHTTGQPVLVGTISVEVSEHLSRLLDRKGVSHEVLNAKNHEREAAIIEDAGQSGAVTIATNMAGRGVDIKLGDGVLELGGLYVLGTERHESRRIDNQLRGRSGRQGDPGETRFYLSAQDEVIRLFAGERIYKILDSKIGPGEGEPIEHSMLTRRIEGAQKKVEEFHFVNRKQVVKYDDVLNDQRSEVYRRRREILEGEDLQESVVGWIEDVVDDAIAAHTEEFSEDWDWDGMWVALGSIYPIRIPLESIDRKQTDLEALKDRVFEDAVSYYEQREREWAEMDPELPRNVERWITLQVMDVRWREHLDNMDYMRQGIGWRGMAQKDPLVEYRSEGTLMFDEMNGAIKQEVVRGLMHAQLEVSTPTAFEQQSSQPGNLHYTHEEAASLEALAAAGIEPGMNGDTDGGFPVVEQRQVDPDKDVGRNDPCWCGSGKKFKRCHGA
jgi:preprotein translocase subunit SecA